jgi:hypothetical protein
MNYTTSPVDFYIDQSVAGLPPKLVSGYAVNWYGADKLKFAVHEETNNLFNSWTATEWRTGGSIMHGIDSMDKCIILAICKTETALVNGVAEKALAQWERGEI